MKIDHQSDQQEYGVVSILHHFGTVNTELIPTSVTGDAFAPEQASADKHHRESRQVLVQRS
ncbi:MAG: hypothetical protein GY768_08655 [Planctomycetaceae bacterium]|nr:hypothetical protein [Planctomycetaceae bacterium]